MNWQRVLLFLSMGVILFVADAFLKAYVHYSIPPMGVASLEYPYGGIPVFDNWCGIQCSVVHVMNKGAAWGVFASMQNYLLYARIAIITGLLVYLTCIRAPAFQKFCLTLIFSGALGNVIDYFVYGHVVDMFYFVFWGYSYPVFNIADSAICCGIVLLIICSLFHKHKQIKTLNP